MPADRIILEGMQFYGYHGANSEERTLGQPYVVDLIVETNLRRPGDTDRLEDTISYSHLYRTVKNIVEGEPQNLLEAVAQRIARRVLLDYPAETALVRVKKVRPPIRGAALEYAAVEICRTRADFAPTDGQQ